ARDTITEFSDIPIDYFRSVAFGFHIENSQCFHFFEPSDLQSLTNAMTAPGGIDCKTRCFSPCFFQQDIARDAYDRPFNERKCGAIRLKSGCFRYWNSSCWCDGSHVPE